jgi:hypothetical protein
MLLLEGLQLPYPVGAHAVMIVVSILQDLRTLGSRDLSFTNESKRCFLIDIVHVTVELLLAIG